MNRPVFALLVFTCVGLGACHRSGPAVCPEGMSLDDTVSKAGQIVWCRSNDGKRAQYIEFHPDGKAKRQLCAYLDGRPEGAFSAWMPDGKIWISGQYAAGQPDGRWVQRDKDGQRVAEGEYRAGRFVAGAPVASTAVCQKRNPR
jgi:hypothetical protein